MSKKKQKVNHIESASSSRLPLLFAGVFIVVVMGVVAFLLLNSQGSSYEPEVTGSARAEVDQNVVDHGDVAFEKPVTSTFTVSNVGDEPLYILGEPQVETLEGC